MAMSLAQMVTPMGMGSLILWIRAPKRLRIAMGGRTTMDVLKPLRRFAF